MRDILISGVGRAVHVLPGAYPCRKCKRDFTTEDGLNQHNLSKHGSARYARPKSRFKLFALLLTATIALGVVGVSFAMREQSHAGGAFHWHPSLTVMINGERRMVPAEIGIRAELWKSHELDQYGSMQPMPWMNMPGMSPLHTHDTSGKIHVESAVTRDYTLKDLLDVWGVSVSQSQVLGHSVDTGHSASVIADGVVNGPTDIIVLKDGQQLQITCGQ